MMMGGISVVPGQLAENSLMTAFWFSPLAKVTVRTTKE
jgi:hypothetical protein